MADIHVATLNGTGAPPVMRDVSAGELESVREEFAHLIDRRDVRIFRVVQYTDTLKVDAAMGYV